MLNYLVIHHQTLDSFEQIGFDDGSNPKAWQSWWTVFYWGWWIAWSPFVGTFIAQISRGRTVRVFILGNMMIPALVTAIWTTIMGGLGVVMEYHALEAGIGNDCYSGDPYTNGTYTRLSCAPPEDQLFILIDYYPLSQFISIITIIAIIGYFVTSSDSASYVIDMITSNGIEEPPKLQRIFWALTEGAVATALLAVGGKDALNALQTVSIAAAWPFTVLLLIMVYGLIKAFNMDKELFARRANQGTTIDSQNNNTMANMYDDNMNNNDDKNDAYDDEIKDWRLGFFDALFNSIFICLQSVFIPCWLQYKNGKKIGMYGKRVNKENICDNIIWIICVFIVPIVFIILHILELWIPGTAYLAWVVYVGWVFIGGVHRIKMREYYHLKGNPIIDVGAYCCCYCFAVSQESHQCEPTVLL